MPFSPVFIFVEPQMGENIGAAARALKNCGLKKIRLVQPRCPWPNPQAYALAAGADDLLDQAQVFQSVEDAVADLTCVFATTARSREGVKPVLTPEEAVACVHTHPEWRVGILFGPERSGLRREQLCHAYGLIVVPLNPDFRSLNLAQAALVMAYTWWRSQANQSTLSRVSAQPWGEVPLATGEEVEGFFQHLTTALDHSGFLYPPHLRPTMLRNLKHLFTRIQLTQQEVRTLRGVLTSFQKGPRNRYLQQEIDPL